jgi:hypothetical protein
MPDQVRHDKCKKEKFFKDLNLILKSEKLIPLRMPCEIRQGEMYHNCHKKIQAARNEHHCVKTGLQGLFGGEAGSDMSQLLCGMDGLGAGVAGILTDNPYVCSENYF